MTRSPSLALVLLATAALGAADACAQPAAPLALPVPERVEYERGIEWGGTHASTRLVLERQPDGSYRAQISGEDHTAQAGIRVEAKALLRLRERLHDMESFPTGSFAGAGNHGYTRLRARGTDAAGQPWSLQRSFFDTSVPALDRRAAQLEQAALALIGEVAAPRLDRFVYERGIEWGGDHAQTRLELTRQSDGSYVANVAGEDQTARSGVAVPAARLKELRGELDAMRDFPTSSFAGAGNHWYTRLRAEGQHPDGSKWQFARSCYDPNHPAGRRAIASLEEVVVRLIDALDDPTAAPLPTVGLPTPAAPGATTVAAPGATTVAAPGATPGATTVAAPGATPGATTVAAPGATPGATTVAAPGATTGATTVAAPGATPGATTVAAPGATTPGATATVTPTPVAAPSASPGLAGSLPQ